jgi:uncharacterized protein (DUF697 family)
MKMNEKGLQGKISEAIFDAISNTAKNREEHYKTNKVPALSEVNEIVSKCGSSNAIISGSLGILPGFLGMAVAVPEIALVLKNQINMIYDIGRAHGKKKDMDKELIVRILFGAVGSTGTFLTIQAGKVLAPKIEAKVLEKLITILGEKIAEKVMASMVAKWVPVVGGIAMASWSKYSTHKIGEKAIEIFSREIVIVESGVVDMQEVMKKESPILSIEQNNLLIIAKVKLLINLMNIDNYKHEKEISYLKEYINSLAIGDLVKAKLLMSLSNVEQINVDYTRFTNAKNDALSVILDMIGLAKKDGQFHLKEESYIKEVALKLGFSSEELSFLL